MNEKVRNNRFFEDILPHIGYELKNALNAQKNLFEVSQN
jgi:hypothetical protein